MQTLLQVGSNYFFTLS